MSASEKGFVKLYEMAAMHLDDCTFSDMVLVYSPGKLVIISVWLTLLDLKSGLGYEAEKDRGGGGGFTSIEEDAEEEEDVEEDEDGNIVNDRDWSKVSIEQYIIERYVPEGEERSEATSCVVGYVNWICDW